MKKYTVIYEELNSNMWRIAQRSNTNKWRIVNRLPCMLEQSTQLYRASCTEKGCFSEKWSLSWFFLNYWIGIKTKAHWSRFLVFVQQLFFSRFLADFDAKYGKLGVFRVEEFIFGYIRLLLVIEPKLTNEIPKYQFLKNICKIDFIHKFCKNTYMLWSVLSKHVFSFGCTCFCQKNKQCFKMSVTFQEDSNDR